MAPRFVVQSKGDEHVVLDQHLDRQVFSSPELGRAEDYADRMNGMVLA